MFAAPLPSSSRRRARNPRDRIVIKVLPFLSHEGADCDPETGERVMVNGCGMLEASAVWTEVACAKRMAAVGENLFGGFFKATVVRGRYPIELIREWNRWDSARRANGLEGSENWEPDYFPAYQHYLLLFLPHGGEDLDSAVVPSFATAHSVFWQVTLALAAAEHEAKFEHRDLHAGNILLSEAGSTPDAASWTDSSGKLYSITPKGVSACIIDYTLARFEDSETGRLFWNPMDDEELFEGQGDRQFDVYRDMREATGGNWKDFCPKTNVLVS